MAAKFLHSLADDNPDLKRQIGCMTGIFQLFDRHHIISSPHITQKRLHPGYSLFNYDSLERGSNIIHQPQSTADMRGMSDKHKISAESSTTSFSSSCSSSMSSLDYKAEADAPFDRIGFPETPMRDPVMKQASTSPHLGCPSLDLRDVVKECIYREARGLCKERDSPRQFQMSKSVDRKQTPTDLKESLRVLAILRETPRHYVEAKELPRLSNEVKDGHWHSISKDAPRFSYDGRTTCEVSFDSHDTLKCPQKLKEPPRLSLDSREGSWRANGSDSKLTNLSRNSNTGDASTSVDNISSLQQRSASQRRPPSIVAKLMGLEALPESYVASDTKSSLSETDSTQGNDQFGKNGFVTPLPVSNFPEFPLKEKEMTSPRWKNPDLVVKPILSTRFPIEPAPWKQQDGNLSSEKLTSRVIKPTARTPDSFPSVYSEIENRLKDLEFKQSGRDLRALKRILETMQVKGLLETKKEEQASNVVRNKRDYELKSTSIQHYTRQETAWESDSAMAIESPIVIMKPAKIVEKGGPFASSVFPIHELSDSDKLQSDGVHVHGKRGTPSSQIAKDRSPRNCPKDASTSFSEKKVNSIKTIIKSTQSLPRSTQFPKENGPSSVKSSGSASPRMQQKKSASEKQSCLLTPSSDSNNPRRQFFKQTTHSGSPSQKLRPKVPNSQSSDDRLSETSNEQRSLSSQWDEVSLQSDSISFDSKMDIEVTSNLQSAEVADGQCPSRKAVEHLVSGSMHKKSTLRWDEDESIAELTTHASDHPSLGSVVDVSVYKFGMPSPVKNISYSRKVEKAQDSKESYHTDQWSPAEGLLINNIRYREINHKKLQSIGRLIQKLRQLNSSHDETRIDYIASLCENTNSDHRYIAEILLASGLLLRALSSELLTFQHHSSGYPINPELFLVLEQTKLSSLLSKEGGSHGKIAYRKLNTEKLHRKLIFDTVNEILRTKLGSSHEPWFKPDGLTRKFVTAQKLLKELCFEIQKLKYVKPDSKDEGDDLKSMLGEDVMRHSENWTGFPGELPGVVLDVERQIFKDLIDEFVIDESLGVTYSRHNKLFGK